jgi:hypothetical protein
MEAGSGLGVGTSEASTSLVPSTGTPRELSGTTSPSNGKVSSTSQSSGSRSGPRTPSEARVETPKESGKSSTASGKTPIPYRKTPFVYGKTPRTSRQPLLPIKSSKVAEALREANTARSEAKNHLKVAELKKANEAIKKLTTEAAEAQVLRQALAQKDKELGGLKKELDDTKAHSRQLQVSLRRCFRSSLLVLLEQFAKTKNSQTLSIPHLAKITFQCHNMVSKSM